MKKLALPIALVFGFAMIGCSDDDSCVDVDGDGYGEGSGCMGPDCDDGDDTVWMDMDGYGDVDGDGENSDTATTGLCTDGTLPAGYSATAGTDCDDTDADAIMLVPAWADADGDGYGGGEEMEVCGDTMYLPPGYADNGDDCDDASDVLFMAWTGYMDWDMDGVPVDVESTVCGTSVMPIDLSTMAGTDCDDIDPYSTNDASHAVGCSFGGTCIDTELGVGFPDGRGVGACATTDCNGQDPTCDTNPMNDTTVACPNGVNDCNGGELCWSPSGGAPTCWEIPNCCVNDPAGHTCSEIIDCLAACGDLLPDTAAYAQCQQFSCVEGAQPTAQELYRVAAECAAAADCWSLQPGGAAAIQGCVQANCLMEFAPCLTDTP